MKRRFCWLFCFIVCSLFFIILEGCHDRDCSQTPQVEETALFQGLRLSTEQRFEEAYGKFRAARIIAHIDGDEEKEFMALKGQADCAFWIGDADSCIDKYLEALPFAKKLNKQFEEFCIYLQLRQAYLAKVDMRNVEWVTQKADSIAEASSDMRLRVAMQNKLAMEALQQRNPKLAEYFFLSNETLLDSMPIEIRQTIHFSVYESLRDFYIGQNKMEKAREYSLKCISSAKKEFRQQQLAYMAYDSYAIICAQQHKRKEAFQALDSMKYGLTLKDGASKTNVMRYHATKGNVHSLLGEWKQACNEYKKALEVVDTTYAKNRTDYYNIMRMLGVALGNREMYNEARDYLIEVAQYNGYIYGERSLAFANSLWDLGVLECRSGNNNMAKRAYASSIDICKKIVADQLRYVSLQDRETFWFAFAPKLFGMTGFALKISDRQSEFTKKCYDALLFSKALLLESDRSMAATINNECSPEEQRLYDEMLGLQNQLKFLMNDYEKNKSQIAEIHRKISDKNKQLTPIISKLGYFSFLNMGFDNIKELLNEDEILLDFTYCISDKQEHHYAVFVVKSGQKYPKLIKVFTEEKANDLLDKASIHSLYNASNAEKMQNLFWNPLAKEIQGKGKRIIYYVPSGILHQISLENIPLNDGSILGDHYSFIRLSSAREIVKIKQKSNSVAMSTAMLYGGLDYDMDTTQMINEASHHHLDPFFLETRGEMVRGDGKYRSLPGTKEEVDIIGKILKKNHFLVTAKTGKKGTEESFMELNKHAPHILHIATHGFYYTPEKADETAYLKGIDDAMLLSGLIMSGGNLAWSGKPVPLGVLSGILTANEIARMDLRGTELVVLSACKTGLGNVTPEGLYGLQRAFKKAGVQTIVMTLWNISDGVTKDFMSRFYEELTKNKRDKRKAFENAKEQIRSIPRYSNPYYWAGFIMLD